MSSRKRNVARNQKVKVTSQNGADEKQAAARRLRAEQGIIPEDDLESMSIESLAAHLELIEAIRAAARRTVFTYLASLDTTEQVKMLYGCSCRGSCAVSTMTRELPGYVMQGDVPYHFTAVGPVDDVYHNEVRHCFDAILALFPRPAPARNPLTRKIAAMSELLCERIESRGVEEGGALGARITMSFRGSSRRARAETAASAG